MPNTGAKKKEQCSATPKIGFYGPTDKVASGRYRVKWPHQYLINNGFEDGFDLLIISKHGWPENPIPNYKKYIFDVCDNHFYNENASHYIHHCKSADLVICNSESMKETIQKVTEVDAFVIPDPFELPRIEPHFGNDILWFGNKWNFKPVTRILPDLEGRQLYVISEPWADNVIPWSLDNMHRFLTHCGVVIIPVDPNKKEKSANRMIEAINGGCFVVAESLPCHEEFKEFAWIGDIKEGLDWYYSNKNEALERVRKGQDYIDEHYSIQTIGKKWDEAIRKAWAT